MTATHKVEVQLLDGRCDWKFEGDLQWANRSDNPIVSNEIELFETKRTCLIFYGTPSVTLSGDHILKTCNDKLVMDTVLKHMTRKLLVGVARDSGTDIEKNDVLKFIRDTKTYDEACFANFLTGVSGKPNSKQTDEVYSQAIVLRYFYTHLYGVGVIQTAFVDAALRRLAQECPSFKRLDCAPVCTLEERSGPGPSTWTLTSYYPEPRQQTLCVGGRVEIQSATGLRVLVRVLCNTKPRVKIL